MRSIVISIILSLFAFSAHAEMVSIKWKPSDSITWVPGNNYIDGHSRNFMNGTVEEKRKVKAEGELQAEIIVPKETKGPIPFMILMHGCSGMNKTLRAWAHNYSGKLVGAGYGVLILDSFTTRGLDPDGVCSDPSQLEWARRRADDAYSALNWLVETGRADPKRVYVSGRSNGATTVLIIMNRTIGSLHKNLFAGAFPVQPSCLYMKNVEFYAPVHMFLAEKDQATSSVLCNAMASTSRAIPVQTKVWKGAHHSYQDNGPTQVFHGYTISYNAQAAEGTIKAIINTLNSQKRSKL